MIMTALRLTVFIGRFACRVACRGLTPLTPWNWLQECSWGVGSPCATNLLASVSAGEEVGSSLRLELLFPLRLVTAPLFGGVADWEWAFLRACHG